MIFQLGCGEMMVSFNADAGQFIDREWNYFQENHVCSRVCAAPRTLEQRKFPLETPFKVHMHSHKEVNCRLKIPQSRTRGVANKALLILRFFLGRLKFLGRLNF